MSTSFPPDELIIPQTWSCFFRQPHFSAIHLFASKTCFERQKNRQRKNGKQASSKMSDDKQNGGLLVLNLALYFPSARLGGNVIKSGFSITLN